MSSAEDPLLDVAREERERTLAAPVAGPDKGKPSAPLALSLVDDAAPFGPLLSGVVRLAAISSSEAMENRSAAFPASQSILIDAGVS